MLPDLGSLTSILAALGLTPALTKPMPGLSGLLDKANTLSSPLLNPLGSILQPLSAALPASVPGAVDSLTRTLAPLAGGLVNGAAPVADVLNPFLGSANTLLGSVPGASALGPLSGVVGEELKQVSTLGKGLGLPVTGVLNLETSHQATGDNVGSNVSPISPSRLFDQSDPSCTVHPYNATIQLERFKPYDEARATVFRYRRQQAVNLGSWFVLEQWMVPSLFTCAAGRQVSELDVVSGWASVDAARQLLEKHWDSFITENDFKYLASIGINTVRLPVGYWTLGPEFCEGTPFAPYASAYNGSWSRIVRAINWADKYGIGVVVDLHGAPGSQNGQPHSGISDGQANLFSDADDMRRTNDVLKFLTLQLTPVSNCVGIEILNEPQNVPQLADFYTQVIGFLRTLTQQAQTFPFYINDAFDLQRFSNYTASRSDFVVQDHHSYFVYTPSDNAESASQHTNDVDTSIANSLWSASQKQRHNLVIHEWSCALTPSSLSQEQDPATARSTFCRSQMDVYTNATSGWSFWSYNKESCSNDPGWCFKSAVGDALPSTFFSYQGQTTASLSTNVNMSLPSYTVFIGSLGGGAPDIADCDSQHCIGTRDVADVPAQKAIAKGYSDGFMTAKIFAQYGMSRLGFVDQYVQDSIVALGANIMAGGEEQHYQDWFMNGLADGEAFVVASIQPT